MTIFIRNAKLSSAAMLGHNIGLNSYNAIYPIQQTLMKYFAIPRGSEAYTMDNLFNSRIPKMLVFGMVDANAYNGHKDSNPFNFKHNDTNFIGLYKDGECVPGRELTPDFSNGLCVREYLTLMSSVGIYGKNLSNSISFEDYKRDGYVLFAFNLTPDLETTSVCKQANNVGSMRLDLRFAKPLPNAINVVMMGIFDGEIQITKTGNVLI